MRVEYCAKSEKHPRSGLEMLKARKNGRLHRRRAGINSANLPAHSFFTRLFSSMLGTQEVRAATNEAQRISQEGDRMVSTAKAAKATKV